MDSHFVICVCVEVVLGGSRRCIYVSLDMCIYVFFICLFFVKHVFHFSNSVAMRYHPRVLL